MDIKNSLAIHCFMGISLMMTGCPESCPREVSYSFNGASRFYPETDSIKLGDTLYLSSSIPFKLLDQQTNTEVNYVSGSEIGSDLGISELVKGTSAPKDAVDKFNYCSKKGIIFNVKNIPSPNVFQQLKYEKLDNHYELLVGLVPTKKGVYVLGSGNGFSNVNNCLSASFEISVSNTDKHDHYYFEALGITLEGYGLQHAYCFKVY